nr:MAG TPA: hypothetical protein [Caudoviricetes sp.]
MLFDFSHFYLIFSPSLFPYDALAKVNSRAQRKRKKTHLKQHLNHERGKDGNKPNLF